ncbi:MarR family winged helix-turn-helix transcriptional regulator [Arthrobacter sp. ERGS1:01]|uniref:MarR family winged helix-turn-helix transcriptional regulator n=1 Tax=Arthrobacter sp. ERGS1:01 TaxID=1704044 RepID=UPI001364DDB5|nr:MarR family winged helix-turn-helix transcriptional regulator [Arthrobacter sp. ERGS1:01]
MLHNNSVVGQLEYELMLLSRYHLRPHHSKEIVLDRSAVVMLSRLENVPPMTLKELSAALRLDASTVHRQVAALLRHEYVCYAPGDGGEVARRVTPTAAGRAALLDTRAIFEEGIGRVVADWPATQQGQLRDLLRAFNEDIERLEGNAWPRP